MRSFVAVSRESELGGYNRVWVRVVARHTHTYTRARTNDRGLVLGVSPLDDVMLANGRPVDGFSNFGLISDVTLYNRGIAFF